MLIYCVACVVICRYDDDGYFPVVPGCKRALSDMLKRLERAGHHVVHFQPSNLSGAIEQWLQHILADGGRNALRDWDGEILDQSIEMNRLLFKFPIWFRKFMIKYLLSLFSPLSAKGALEAFYPRSPNTAADLWDSLDILDERVAEILKGMNRENIDVVLAPGFPLPGNIFSHNIICLHFFR